MSNEVQNTDSTYTLAAAKLRLLDLAAFSRTDTEIKGNAVVTTFRRTGVDPQYPVEMKILQGATGEVGDPESKYNTSIRYTIWNKYTDPDGNVSYEPIELGFFANTRRIPFMLSTDVTWIYALTNFFSVVMGNTAAGVPDWDGIDKLAGGITDLDFESISRT